MLHYFIKPVSGSPRFLCTFIYGFNEKAKRVVLWEQKTVVTTPWLACGDFNCVMGTNERTGSQVREGEMRYMKQCIYVTLWLTRYKELM